MEVGAQGLISFVHRRLLYEDYIIREMKGVLLKHQGTFEDCGK